MTKEEILKKIKKVKSKPYSDIRIKCNFGKLKYNLLLLTKESINNPKIIKLLSLWREKHEFWFQSQFKVTFDGTQKWLKDRVVNTPDRLLFMIKVKNRYIGHIGLFRFDFNKKTCEIDNIVRGVNLYPGIMSNAIEYMMSWGKTELGLKNYTLETTSDNQKAISLYTKLGFYEYKRIPLVETNDKGYNEWKPAPKNYNNFIKRYEIFMKIKNKQKFKRSAKKISFAGPSITQKEVDYVIDATKNGFYETFDKDIKALEKTVAEYTGMKYALAGFCATHSLHLACLVCGFKKGDEVICTDFSWVATAYVISYTGATPVFVDIDPKTWCIDPKAIEKAITKRTKGIMVVDSFGQAANWDEIKKIAKKYKLKIVEDSAPALGTLYKGKKAGSFGDVGCISFHGAKIAASGEGGMFLTNDKKMYEKAILLSNMGRTNRLANFWCDSLGYEYQMANVTAALARAQVERIEDLVTIKRNIFNWYYDRLKNIPELEFVVESKNTRSNYCYPAVLLKSNKITRDKLIAELKKYNIHAREAFPRMSRFPIYKGLKLLPNPVASNVEKNGFNLPAAANITKNDVNFVCDVLENLIK